MKFWLVCFFITTNILAQDVLSSNDYESTHQTTNISDFNWLQGHWKGFGFGGKCDEIWLPAMDNALHGIFRFSMADKLIFTEYMIIEKLEDNIYVKLKHFNRDLSGWEDKDEWMKFPFIKLEGQTAYFNGLTYKRDGNRLFIYLKMKKNDDHIIETFEFTLTHFMH